MFPLSRNTSQPVLNLFNQSCKSRRCNSTEQLDRENWSNSTGTSWMEHLGRGIGGTEHHPSNEMQLMMTYS